LTDIESLKRMTNKEKRDAVLRRMLRTPPEPHVPKTKQRQHPRGADADMALKEAQDAFGADDPNWTNGGRAIKCD